MPMDFSLNTYYLLLNELSIKKFSFQTVAQFFSYSKSKAVIIRHDIDRLPQNALSMGMIEYNLGVSASYYFRIVKGVYNETIIRKIAELGHEIGYHYEDLSLCNGDYKAAIKHFELHLEKFRKIYPVKTICMHGSPLSKHDNRDLWKQYDYRDFGIVGEPYFDVNFNEVFYITDTGRKWNNSAASVRDRVASGFDIPIKSTHHLMALAEQGVLPDHMMITIHPQRWHDKPLPWVKELIWQNLKNIAKGVLIKTRRPE